VEKLRLKNRVLEPTEILGREGRGDGMEELRGAGNCELGGCATTFYNENPFLFAIGLMLS
jgi:hypothetical protein